MLDRAVRIGMIGCGSQAHVHFGALQAGVRFISIQYPSLQFAPRRFPFGVREDTIAQ